MFISAVTRAGIEAARWLREVCDVPIVFVTAHSDADTLERIHAVLPPPCCPNRFIRRHWLTRYQRLLIEGFGFGIRGEQHHRLFLAPGA